MSPVLQAVDKAQILIDALPYIRSYRNKILVVKLGGEPLDDPGLAAKVAADLALLVLVGVHVVVVHGGGPQITREMKAKGVTARFSAGLRITDDDSMEVVQQVLIGQINTALVGALNQAGVAAVGISGIDTGFIRARRRVDDGGRDLGRVGDIVEVKPSLITSLLAQGVTPVVAPVASAHDGTTLNVNADAAAAAVAGALDAEKLVFVTNVEGLYADLGDRDSLISELKSGDLAALLPGLSSGMRPKAKAALSAISQGVAKVHILDGRDDHALLLEIFTPDGIGTQVLP